MTLQQLRYVIQAADSRSMNEAAKKLFVSQPNLSATVREVEEELGITVFMRNNRGITVTAEGEEFFRIRQNRLWSSIICLRTGI